jgi:hypothetical protein
MSEIRHPVRFVCLSVVVFAVLAASATLNQVRAGLSRPDRVPECTSDQITCTCAGNNTEYACCNKSNETCNCNNNTPSCAEQP